MIKLKVKQIITFASFLLFYSLAVNAASGIVATEEDIVRLKEDLLEGIIEIGQTRLKKIRETYGEASSISDADRRVTYDYGDVSLVFDKKKVWRDWGYDGFKQPIYTDAADDLRFDLESLELVGENIMYSKIAKDYGEPTASEETSEDGDLSVYYYGNIKMIFENVVVLSSWKGDIVEEVNPEGTLTGK